MLIFFYSNNRVEMALTSIATLRFTRCRFSSSDSWGERQRRFLLGSISPEFFILWSWFQTHIWIASPRKNAFLATTIWKIGVNRFNLIKQGVSSYKDCTMNKILPFLSACVKSELPNETIHLELSDDGEKLQNWLKVGLGPCIIKSTIAGRCYSA